MIKVMSDRLFEMEKLIFNLKMNDKEPRICMTQIWNVWKLHTARCRKVYNSSFTVNYVCSDLELK